MLLVLGCASQSESSTLEYLRWVGDIEYDPQLDTTDFTLCNRDEKVLQYFNFGVGLQYKDEKKAIKDQFFKNYHQVETNQSGWIRIRFIVNCEGETGRFRVISSNMNYQQFDFDERITNQLMAITKSLKGWKVLSLERDPLDYYQYLIFKIDQGKIVEILP